MIRASSLPLLPHQSVNMHVLASIDSTNQYLKNLPSSSSIELCCAEEQTNGRGRLGRQWYSPAGENIYCSMRWQLCHPLSKLSALSLVVALAILAALKTLQVQADISIKWPNDLYWQGKKLGGILIESVSESIHHHLVVVGIGLNVNTKSALKHIQSKLDRPWCSLADITNQYWDRNQVIGILLGTVHQYLQRYLSEGFAPFMFDWEKVDYLYGQTVQVTLANTHHLNGIASGVSPSGQLRIQDSHGKIHDISSGEVTLLSASCLSR